MALAETSGVYLQSAAERRRRKLLQGLVAGPLSRSTGRGRTPAPIQTPESLEAAQRLRELYMGAEEAPAPRVLTGLAQTPGVVELGAVLPAQVPNAAGEFLTRFGQAIPRAGRQLGTVAKDAPFGLFALEEAIRKDIADSPSALDLLTGKREYQDLYPERTTEIVKATGEQVYKDIKDPEGRPGYLLADLLAFGTGGASAATRLSTGAARAGEAGATGASAVARARAFASGVKEPLPTETYPLTVRRAPDPETGFPGGSVTVHRLVTRNRLLAPASRWRNRRLQDELDAAAKGEAFQRRDWSQDYGVVGSIANRLDVAGKLREGYFSAEAVFGRELARKRVVDIDVARAPLAELAAARGRAIAANPHLENLPESIRGGLTDAQQTAVRERAIAGKLDPAEVDDYLDRAIAVEGAKIEALTPQIDAVANQLRETHDWLQRNDPDVEGYSAAAAELQRLEGQHDYLVGQQLDLQQAVSELQVARPHLNQIAKEEATGAETRIGRSARLAANLSKLREEMLIQRVDPRTGEPLLRRESADWRKAAPAAQRRGEPLTETYAAGIRRGKVIGEKYPERVAEIRTIDREIRRVEKDVQRQAKRTRVRTRAEAEARLSEVKAEYEAFLDRMADSLMTGRERRSEQARRNIQNARMFKKSGGVRAGAARRAGETGMVRKLPTIKQELRSEVETMIEKAKKAQPDDVVVRQVSSWQNEIASLTKALTTEKTRGTIFEDLDAPEARGGYVQARPKGEAEPAPLRSGEQPANLEGQTDLERTLRTEEEKARRAQIAEEREGLGRVPVKPSERLTAGLSVLRDARDRLEAEHARKSAKTPWRQEISIIDAERRREIEAPEGSFYVDLDQFENVRYPSATGVTPRGGQYGYPPFSKGRRDPHLTHRYEGKNIQTGTARVDAVNATMEDYHTAIVVTSALDAWNTQWQASSPVRRTKYDLPVREPSKVPHELKVMTHKGSRAIPMTQKEIDDYYRSIPEEQRKLVERTMESMPEEQRKGVVVLQALADHMHPTEYTGAKIGTNLTERGVRWIDRRFLADLTYLDAPGLGYWGTKAADAINNPARFLYVYGRVAYVLNLPGNLGMQVMTQGWLAPQNYRMALTMRKQLVALLGRDRGERLAAAIESGVGEGRARAVTVPTGFGARLTQSVANFWASWIDRHSRVSSFLHEARREGAELPKDGFWTKEAAESLERFVFRNQKGRTVAFRRGNKGMVEFNNLTAFERNTLRHLIFIYPWMSRATVWALRTAVEHPIKTWTLSELAQYARENDPAGPLPSYLSDRGYFPVKMLNKHEALLVNPSSINTFETAQENARLLATLVSTGVGQRTPREAASPALNGLIGVLTGQSSLGQDYQVGGLRGFAEEFLKATPEFQMARRAGLVDQPKGEIPLSQQPILQGKNLGETFGPFFLGGLYPRKANLEVAHEKARIERLANMPPVQRASAKVTESVQTLLSEARRVGIMDEGEKLPGYLQRAISFQRAMEVGYARAAEEEGIPLNRFGELDRTHVDLMILQERGITTQAETDAEWEYVQQLDDVALRAYRRRLHEYAFHQADLSNFRSAIRDAGGRID